MSPQDLSALGAGFSNEALGSQQVFRAALDALSRPGRLMPVTHDAEVPAGVRSAAAALLLALLDADGSVWLSPSLAATPAGAWLRFHTGCRVVDEPAQAQFLWVASAHELPALDSLAQGTDAYPDQSATCVIEVEILAQGPGWQLSGPGIEQAVGLCVQGLPDDFPTQWAANHALFPCGVDVFLAADTHIVGLPRTTRLAVTHGD